MASHLSPYVPPLHSILPLHAQAAFRSKRSASAPSFPVLRQVHRREGLGRVDLSPLSEYNVNLTFVKSGCEMTHDEKLRRWLKARKRLGFTVKQTAAMLNVAVQTCFNWNCGSQSIPETRLKQLESMK
jgi:hypothetical protein